MTYTPTVWEDNVTPVTAVNLNKMESGIAAAETPEGAQAKADVAVTVAELYTETKNSEHLDALDPHEQYALDTDLNIHTTNLVEHITSVERTTWDAKETTAGAQAKADVVQENLTEHQADYVRNPGFAPTTGGVANTYAAATTPALPALVDGVSIYLDVQVANTGASTLNWDSKGAKAIVDGKGNALIAGKMPLNGIVGVRYNASTTNFQLLGEGGDYGTAGSAQTLAGYTLGTSGGVIPGTMPSKVGSASVFTPGAADIAITQGYYGGVVGDGKVAAVVVPVANVLTGTTIAAQAGTMPNNPPPTTTITTQDGAATIPAGYNPGGTVTANMTNLSPTTIIAPNVVGGITGTASNIKSIQRGTISLTSGTSTTATISAVDTSKSIILVCSSIDSYGSNYDWASNWSVIPSFTSSTVVSFNRIGTPTGSTVSISYQVIEFSNVKSLQTGMTSGVSTNTTVSATINSVDTLKSILFISARNNSIDDHYLTTNGWLSSATQITFRGMLNLFSVYYRWYVVEFN